MKKTIALILILLFSTVALSEGIDFSNMTNEELQAVIDGATKELESRDKSEHVASESDSILVDNEYIKAEFLGFENYPDLEMFLVSLRVTNKTDKVIWVYLDEASVNDDMVRVVMSGVPLYVLPWKSGSNSFIFSFTQISIDSFEYVETVSFKLKVTNKETLDVIWTSPEITVIK